MDRIVIDTMGNLQRGNVHMLFYELQTYLIENVEFQNILLKNIDITKELTKFELRFFIDWVVIIVAEIYATFLHNFQCVEHIIF